MDGLSLDELASLLEEPDTSSSSIPQVLGYGPPLQHGPLRYKDTQKPCLSRGCRSPTYWRLKGVPRCSIHAMREMNEMLLELGVEQ